MFTGIVQFIGRIARIDDRGADRRLVITRAGLSQAAIARGTSVCVSGVCLSVAALTRATFTVEVSAETLACTTLGALKRGDRVNLEPALTLTTPLGGHLVSGHVDGVGKVRDLRADGSSLRITIAAPRALRRYLCRKGSICVDGVSLTINAVRGSLLEVNLIPITRRATTLGSLAPGQQVNLEVDLIARYLERLQEERGE
jgi:riboflavin synthase